METSMKSSKFKRCIKHDILKLGEDAKGWHKGSNIQTLDVEIRNLDVEIRNLDVERPKFGCWSLDVGAILTSPTSKYHSTSKLEISNIQISIQHPNSKSPTSKLLGSRVPNETSLLIIKSKRLKPRCCYLQRQRRSPDAFTVSLGGDACDSSAAQQAYALSTGHDCRTRRTRAAFTPPCHKRFLRIQYSATPK